MDNEISTNLKKAETPTIEPKDENHMVQSALMKAGTQATTLKEAIDIGITGKALQDDGVVDDLKDKKKLELNEDANARLIAAMKERIEKEKELIEIEKQKIETETQKAKAYFEAHKKVLGYAFCYDPMTIPYMKVMSVVGTIMMYVLRYGLFGIFFVAGKLLEMFAEIVGAVGGEIKKEALKIIVGVAVVVFLIAVGIACYIGIPLLLNRY